MEIRGQTFSIGPLLFSPTLSPCFLWSSQRRPLLTTALLYEKEQRSESKGSSEGKEWKYFQDRVKEGRVPLGGRLNIMSEKYKRARHGHKHQ